MNMVMTFVLHPLSHYNSITELHARFLLSLLEHLTIDFPSHFIISIIDVHLDSASRDKLIFASAITRILRHFSIPFPSSDHFTVMCAIDYATIKCSEAQFRVRQSDSAASPFLNSCLDTSRHLHLSRFTKGLVMTFVLHPLSHYNSITEPRARFLLSLLEHLTIDLPSHFILSLIDVHLDVASHDKLIFPSTIMKILRHFSVPFPSSDHFPIMCAIDYAIDRKSVV